MQQKVSLSGQPWHLSSIVEWVVWAMPRKAVIHLIQAGYLETPHCQMKSLLFVSFQLWCRCRCMQQHNFRVSDHFHVSRLTEALSRLCERGLAQSQMSHASDRLEQYSGNWCDKTCLLARSHLLACKPQSIALTVMASQFEFDDAHSC